MGQYSQSRGMGFQAILSGGAGYSLDVEAHDPSMSGSVSTHLADPKDGTSRSIYIREGKYCSLK